jgi:hypothetical protein
MKDLRKYICNSLGLMRVIHNNAIHDYLINTQVSDHVQDAAVERILKDYNKNVIIEFL